MINYRDERGLTGASADNVAAIKKNSTDPTPIYEAIPDSRVGLYACKVAGTSGSGRSRGIGI
jgi:hypothetical protein